MSKECLEWDPEKDLNESLQKTWITAVKENGSMSAKTKYTDEPIGKVKVIPDFLPAPEELAFKDDTVKVTISLSKESVDFFKAQAKKHHTQYQKMIRRLLDVYTLAHMEPAPKRSGLRKKRTVNR
ncbi:conserved hypothetical protein [hydrothermal vent metagenome]|uniref:CopG family transcriptional regulator n=1 Tax=hydrothermal vent metagenome TaxID=652676 RepID=A0A3B0Y3A3_9ZZZZ